MEYRIAQGAGPLFVYGTLQFPRILEALLGRVPRRERADLPGWRAAALERRPYPGLVLAPGRSVRGMLLDGLSPAEWSVLDAFEGADYVARPVTLADGRAARTYVWRGGEGDAEVRAEDWDREAGAERCLAVYAGRLA